MDDRARRRGGGDRSRGAPPARGPVRAVVAGAGALRLGPRAQSQRRQRRGGRARAAGSVGGKFGVRGGGYSMSNSLAFGLKSAQWIDTPEPATRAREHEPPRPRAARISDPPVKMLFVYNCNPAGDGAGSEPRAAGAAARGSLHRRLRTGLHRYRALRRRRAARRRRSSSSTTSRSRTARSRMQLVQAGDRAVSARRAPTREVFSALAERLGVGRAEDEIETLMRITGRMRTASARS